MAKRRARHSPASSLSALASQGSRGSARPLPVGGRPDRIGGVTLRTIQAGEAGLKSAVARGGARLLLAHPGVDLVILDDGFQHRRLARDADVVLLDATNPMGFRRLLPRGLLREPVEALSRASAVVATRSERVLPAALAAL